MLGRTGRAGNKGVAYTFLSPEEGQYSEDILRVLELSNQPVPNELRGLVKTFKEQITSGAIATYRGSGFKGRGNHFIFKC